MLCYVTLSCVVLFSTVYYNVIFTLLGFNHEMLGYPVLYCFALYDVMVYFIVTVRCDTILYVTVKYFNIFSILHNIISTLNTHTVLTKSIHLFVGLPVCLPACLFLSQSVYLEVVRQVGGLVGRYLARYRYE